MIKVVSLLLASLLGVAAALFPTTSPAQQGTERPARTRREAPAQNLNRVFKNYERMRLDTAEAARQVRLTGRLSINTELQSLDLELEPHDLRAEGYMAEETVDGGARLPVISDGPVRTFKGRVLGNKDAQARFTIDEDSFEGSILTPHERYYVEPARRYVRSAGPTEFLFYRASDVIETEPATCSIPSLHERVSQATDQLGEVDSISPAAQGTESVTTKALAIPLEAELATEADFEYVTALGGTVNANNEILSIMNQVEGVYQTQIGLSFKIVFQHTWATSADPYTTVDPVLALKEFTNHWNANFQGVIRDLAHMWTGKNLTNTAGVGWTGVVCGSPTNAYGLSERLTSAPQKYVLPAHEIGHNFNATHSDANASCANTIMQPIATSTSTLSFCQLSRDQITAFINANSTCLSRAPVCTYSIAPTSASLPATGGTGSITVTATAGCTWTAASNVTWITVTAGASGAGNGTVSYSVAANTATTSRTGTITVAGKTFTVTQAAATPACTFAIAPTSASYPSSGGTGSVTVTTTTGCAWTARSNVTWITVTAGASGTGNGTVSYSVAANTATTSRSGTITIAGRTFTVTQAGAPPPCAYTISPTSASFSSASATGSITVTTTANCAWTAKSNVTWITVTAGASGAGNGTVSYSVAANTATVSRTGTITVAGKTFTVTQAAAPCNYSITPTSASYPSGGGASKITVTTTTGCAWTAKSNVTWITITAGASGSGPGSVSYSVAANTATTSRTGTITVAGKTFTITQAAAPPPGPALSSLTLNPTLVAGCKGVTGTVRISAPAPANGTVVTLSDTLASTTLPSSVTIPAGATSKTFTITTVPVSASQTGTVTAKLGTVTKSATLTVRPIGVLAVAVSPNPIIGGDTATGRVSLECVAGPGNITVTLTDNIAATTLPASIIVPAGTSSQTFQIKTAAVTATQTGTLTATANGISKSVAVTVRPIGLFSLTLSPNPAQSGSDVTGTVTLERAAAPGNIVVSLSSSNPAIAALNVSSITIPAGTKTGTFTVHTAEGSSNSSVVITASANGTSKSVTLVISGQATE